ncbi:282_t:CDS:2, partial [Dentiscutata heterogama]
QNTGGTKFLQDALSTTSILPSEHNPYEISSTLFEFDSTLTPSDDQHNSETVSSEPNSNIPAKRLHCINDSQTYEFEFNELSFNLHEKQSLNRKNASISACSPHEIFCHDATIFEIATCVANHPEILSMANMMHKNKQISWKQPFEEFTLREPSVLPPNQNKEKPSIGEMALETRLQIWLEELKCLFLRTCNPSQTIFD